MTCWVALLRGVNVNGVTVRSADLRALSGQLGLQRPRTVLASGNLVFDAPEDQPRGLLKERIEAGLRERFGYDAWIVLLEATRLAAVCDAYPFPRRDDERHPYVVFSSDEDVLAQLTAHAPGPDGDADERVQRAGGVLYWEVRRGSSTDTPFARASGAARYKPHITTRNLRTLDKVLAAAGHAGT